MRDDKCNFNSDISDNLLYDYQNMKNVCQGCEIRSGGMRANYMSLLLCILTND